MSIQRRNSSTPLPQRRRSKGPYTLIVYVRQVDALVGAAPHMLLVPDAHIDADVRAVLEMAHRASTNTTLGDDNGSREHYRARAAALCDQYALTRTNKLARDPRAAASLPLHPGIFSCYRLLAPASNLAGLRINTIYFVYGVLGA